VFGKKKEPAPTQRTGVMSRVPCPYPECTKPNDFREVGEEYLLNQWTGQFSAKEQMSFTCDHCGRPMQVVAAERTIVITVRQGAPVHGVQRT